MGDPYAQFGGKDKFDEFIKRVLDNVPGPKYNPMPHSPTTIPDPPPIGNFKCDMVIARYKESLAWLDRYNKYTFNKIVVYNKGPNDGICKLNSLSCEQKTLKNEGRCDHTYLYHIINNYDNLADVTIFTKGSSSAHREKKKLLFTISKVFETRNSVFSVSNTHTPVHLAAKGFTLDAYQASYSDNQNSSANSVKTKPACLRPFDTWYTKHFPDINVNYIVFAGIFAVSRKHIHNRPIEFYQKLLKQLEGHSNPEVGHYIERSWIAIFHPPKKADKAELDAYMACMYNDIIHEIYYGGGRTKRIRRRQKRRHTR